ncbi:MAG: glycosyltransferase family 9 protein [Candidatus Lernaella stagnicola]|nr:glycosyltransferase family 9 protein [Candidatus Lernaella stagnicola]
MADPKRILIVKLGAVGDCLHTLVAARALREHFPDATLGWVVETKSQEVVSGHPLLDHVHIWRRKESSAELKRGHAIKAWRPLRETVAEIRQVGYDVAIDFQNLIKSGYFTWKSGAPIRIGFRRLREGNLLFTNTRVPVLPESHHMVRRYLGLLRPLGVVVEGTPPAEPIHIPEDKKAQVDDFFGRENLRGPIVAINPAASLKKKLWPPERYAEVADRLVESHRVTPLITWGPGEEPLVEAVQRYMKHAPLVAPPTTIKELAYLFSRCRMYLGNDSGPMHLAAAMGCAVVGLFGPTDPKRVAPWTDQARCVEPLEPFSKHRPVDGVMVEQVVRAAVELLES